MAVPSTTTTPNLADKTLRTEGQDKTSLWQRLRPSKPLKRRDRDQPGQFDTNILSIGTSPPATGVQQETSHNTIPPQGQAVAHQALVHTQAQAQAQSQAQARRTQSPTAQSSPSRGSLPQTSRTRTAYSPPFSSSPYPQPSYSSQTQNLRTHQLPALPALPPTDDFTPEVITPQALNSEVHAVLRRELNENRPTQQESQSARERDDVISLINSRTLLQDHPEATALRYNGLPSLPPKVALHHPGFSEDQQDQTNDDTDTQQWPVGSGMPPTSTNKSNSFGHIYRDGQYAETETVPVDSDVAGEAPLEGTEHEEYSLATAQESLQHADNASELGMKPHEMKEDYEVQLNVLKTELDKANADKNATEALKKSTELRAKRAQESHEEEMRILRAELETAREEKKRFTDELSQKLREAEFRETQAEKKLRLSKTELGDLENQLNILAQQQASRLEEKDRELTRTSSSLLAIQSLLHDRDEAVKQWEQHYQALQKDAEDQNKLIDSLSHKTGQSRDNGVFEESYLSLQNLIQKWTTDYFEGPTHSRAAVAQDVRKLAGDYNDYIESPSMRPKLVEAYVWWLLQVRVFSDHTENAPNLWWAHPQQWELSGLLAFLKPARKSTACSCLKMALIFSSSYRR
jgi:hypothetical protein